MVCWYALPCYRAAEWRTGVFRTYIRIIEAVMRRYCTKIAVQSSYFVMSSTYQVILTLFLYLLTFESGILRLSEGKAD
jgi:hypothetical protein